MSLNIHSFIHSLIHCVVILCYVYAPIQFQDEGAGPEAEAARPVPYPGARDVQRCREQPGSHRAQERRHHAV